MRTVARLLLGLVLAALAMPPSAPAQLGAASPLGGGAQGRDERNQPVTVADLVPLRPEARRLSELV